MNQGDCVKWIDPWKADREGVIAGPVEDGQVPVVWNGGIVKILVSEIYDVSPATVRIERKAKPQQPKPKTLLQRFLGWLRG